jgi:hypothetical protein
MNEGGREMADRLEGLGMADYADGSPPIVTRFLLQVCAVGSFDLPRVAMLNPAML